MTPQEQRVAQWIRTEIRALRAYHVPDASGLVKLDAMENPYTWPSDLVARWLETLREVSLNRYPDAAAGRLKDHLRSAFNIPDDMDVVLGNGSDELIQMLAMAVAAPQRIILAPEPGFVMYRMIATFVGMRYIGVPLRQADFALDMPAMRKALHEHRPALTFLAYPNNPTGNLFAEDDVREIIAAASGIVVIDEAYAAFAERSCMSLLREYDNLLVMRTVSKMGLAGLRLGLLVGAPAWLREVDKIRLPYNINVLTQASAEFALQNRQMLDQQTADICRDRAQLYDALSQLPGVVAFRSQANFILFRVPSGRADAIFADLRDNGVLIKNMNGAQDLLSDCLRVTVGRPEENRRFVEALRAAL